MCKRTEKHGWTAKREKIEKQQKSFIKRLSFQKFEDVSNFNWRKHDKGEITTKLGMYENITRDDEVH